jgi:hypothetical protein
MECNVGSNETSGSNEYCFITTVLTYDYVLINNLHTTPQQKRGTAIRLFFYSVLDTTRDNWTMMKYKKEKNLRIFYDYIHTYHSRFVPGGVAEVSQIFLWDTHVLTNGPGFDD